MHKCGEIIHLKDALQLAGGSFAQRIDIRNQAEEIRNAETGGIKFEALKSHKVLIC